MRHPRSSLPVLAAASAVLLTACVAEPEEGGAAAEAYPAEDITLYVPYAPGGPTDLAARTVGDCLAADFGRTVVVENREGASGSLGMQAMIQGGADGYSLSLIAVPASATNPLQEEVGYTNDDYVPIAAVTEIPSVLAVGQGSRFPDARALFAEAQQNPGRVTVGVPGATTSQAMELQRLAEQYGVELSLVPFTGNAEMTTAVLGDQPGGARRLPARRADARRARLPRAHQQRVGLRARRSGRHARRGPADPRGRRRRVPGAAGGDRDPR
jgi:tripartite-type tricarboxylate transporter receptor subunit TctC